MIFVVVELKHSLQFEPLSPLCHEPVEDIVLRAVAHIIIMTIPPFVEEFELVRHEFFETA